MGHSLATIIPDILLFKAWIICVDLLMVYAFISLTYRPNSRIARYIPFPVLIWIVFFLSVTGFAAPDYYNYIHILGMLEKYRGLMTIEPLYWIIAEFVHYKNYLFRFLILSIVYLGLSKFIIKYSIDKNITLSIFILLLFFSFSNILRATICDVIFYLGALPFLEKKNVKRGILLLLSMTLAYFCHKSAFILFVPFILCFIPINKVRFQLLILLYPLFVLIGILVTRFIFASYFEESSYADSAGGDGSRSAMISRFFQYIYWTGFIIIGIIKSRGDFNRSGFKSKLHRLFFWYGYIGLVLILNPASHYLFVRVINHGCIPFLLVISNIYVTSTKITRKRILVLFGLVFLSIQISFYLMTTYNKDLLNANTYIS